RGGGAAARVSRRRSVGGPAVSRGGAAARLCRGPLPRGGCAVRRERPGQPPLEWRALLLRAVCADAAPWGQRLPGGGEPGPVRPLPLEADRAHLREMVRALRVREPARAGPLSAPQLARVIRARQGAEVR